MCEHKNTGYRKSLQMGPKGVAEVYRVRFCLTCRAVLLKVWFSDNVNDFLDDEERE